MQKNSKKIIILSIGLSSGGSERVASILANNFYRQGCSVTFVSMYTSKEVYTLDDGVEYHYVGESKGNKISSYFARVKRVNKLIKDIQPDAIISFIYYEGLFLKKNKNCKLIYTLRFDPYLHGKLKKYVMSKVYKKANNVVFQTEHAKNFFCKKIQDKGVVICNPLTSSIPNYKDFEHEKTVITACRLSKEKNVSLLIKAFGDFYKTHKDYKLKIFGEGPEKENLESQIKQLNLEESVFLMGRTTQIFSEYVKAEIFALTSNHEGMSNSMIEALAIGVPSVITDCPVYAGRMFIKNGENGFLVEVGNTNGVCTSLCTLADNKELRDKFSLASSALRERLNVNNICNEWAKLF